MSSAAGGSMRQGSGSRRCTAGPGPGARVQDTTKGIRVQVGAHLLRDAWLDGARILDVALHGLHGVRRVQRHALALVHAAQGRGQGAGWEREAGRQSDGAAVRLQIPTSNTNPTLTHQAVHPQTPCAATDLRMWLAICWSRCASGSSIMTCSRSKLQGVAGLEDEERSGGELVGLARDNPPHCTKPPAGLHAQLRTGQVSCALTATGWRAAAPRCT